MNESATSPFASMVGDRPISARSRGVPLVAHFDPPADEYRRVRESVGLFDRSDRALAIVTGPDRKTWLHNVVTNAVNTLEDDAGCYAFAIDIRGRVVFDLNILTLPDRLWLDIDAAVLPTALTHLNKYLIMEKAEVSDASDRTARLGVAGPQAAAIAGQLGVPGFDELPALKNFWIENDAVRFVRHDFAGIPGFELIFPRTEAATWWQRMTCDLGVRPAGFDTLDALRIEAGIPWLGRDIDEKTLPPETGQVERGIHYKKGCYLGQEVIERMRSHGSLAKRLVRLRVEQGAGIEIPSLLKKGDLDAGRVTSLVPHPVGGGWIGLGYLKSSVKEADGLAVGDSGASVTLIG
jgi:folate-binding protein YgfZ